jgi:hypothetical protein
MASNGYSCQQSSLNSVESLRCVYMQQRGQPLGTRRLNGKNQIFGLYKYIYYNYNKNDIIVTIIRT